MDVGPDAVRTVAFDAPAAWTAAAKRTAEISPALSTPASRMDAEFRPQAAGLRRQTDDGIRARSERHRQD
jgi:hypothetical protein